MSFHTKACGSAITADRRASACTANHGARLVPVRTAAMREWRLARENVDQCRLFHTSPPQTAGSTAVITSASLEAR